MPAPGTVPANYAMDQRVVTNTQPNYSINDALGAIPTISIAMNPADFLGSNGIYQNPKSTGTPSSSEFGIWVSFGTRPSGFGF